MGYKNIAILHDNSTYAQGLAEATKKYLEALGVTAVFYDAINPKDNDFSPTLTKLKALNPDVIYFTGYYAQGGLLLKQAQALGMTSAVDRRQRHEQHGSDQDRRRRERQGRHHHDRAAAERPGLPRGQEVPRRLQGQVQRRAEPACGR